MIYIHTALSVEASPIIEGFKLKKDMDTKEFQVFGNEDVILIVSGVGKVKCAMGIAYLFGKYGVCEKDILLNVGYCGSSNLDVPLGTLKLANKVRYGYRQGVLSRFVCDRIRARMHILFFECDNK
ncbi:MAG TPA: hypothetical protein PKM70_08225 [Clostridia bacterium]|nr:hypothetical protein [Clostridia bacterium]